MEKTLNNSHWRSQMKGQDETDILANCFPIPKQHSDGTQIHPNDDFRDCGMRESGRRTDLNRIASFLFGQGRFLESLNALHIPWNWTG